MKSYSIWTDSQSTNQPAKALTGSDSELLCNSLISYRDSDSFSYNMIDSVYITSVHFRPEQQ